MESSNLWHLREAVQLYSMKNWFSLLTLEFSDWKIILIKFFFFFTKKNKFHLWVLEGVFIPKDIGEPEETGDKRLTSQFTKMLESIPAVWLGKGDRRGSSQLVCNHPKSPDVNSAISRAHTCRLHWQLISLERRLSINVRNMIQLLLLIPSTQDWPDKEIVWKLPSKPGKPAENPFNQLFWKEQI